MSPWVDQYDEYREPKHINWDVETASVRPYQHIMVVIDDTPSMPHTVRHAVRLATLSNAEINFFSVLNVPAAAGMPDILAINDDLINELTQHIQSLLDWAAATATCAGVPCCTHIRWGQVLGTILYLADTTQCDLIIMGTPAERSWLRFFQPSITKRVAVQAHQPVLIIKAPGAPSGVEASF